MDAPRPVSFGGSIVCMDGSESRNNSCQGKSSANHRYPPAIRPQRLNTDIATLFRIGLTINLLSAPCREAVAMGRFEPRRLQTGGGCDKKREGRGRKQ
jgi:hypothetical protein